VVVAAPFQRQAEDIFGRLGVKVVTSHLFLGGCIGDPLKRDEFVLQKTQQWSGFVRKFVAIASSRPQAAFAAVTKSLQCEWTFLMRVTPSCGHLLMQLENSFSSCFLPALFGVEVSANERQLFALPSKLGGLDVWNPVDNTSLCFESSVHSTAYLKDSIFGNVLFELDAYITTVQSARLALGKLSSEHS